MINNFSIFLFFLLLFPLFSEYLDPLSESHNKNVQGLKERRSTDAEDGHFDLGQSFRYAWCPDVEGCKDPKFRNITNSNDEPDLCRQKWIFILSTGRSGSTSILESLNAISPPRAAVTFRLRGEHEGGLTDIVTFMEHLSGAADSMKSSLGGNGMVHGSGSRQRQMLFQQIQRLFVDIDPPFSTGNATSSPTATAWSSPFAPLSDDNTILGFKEIRYNSDRHVHFLKAVFPCSRIIFNNRRDSEAQRESAFYKKYANVAELRTKNAESERLSRLYPATSFLLPLESLSPKGMARLLDWMGVQGCSFKALCHSNTGGYSKKPCGIKGLLQGRCMLDLDRAVGA